MSGDETISIWATTLFRAPHRHQGLEYPPISDSDAQTLSATAASASAGDPVGPTEGSRPLPRDIIVLGSCQDGPTREVH